MSRLQRRRRWTAVAVLALGVVALGGCASGGKSGAGASGDKVTLSYGFWDPNQEPAMKEIVKAFEAENPNITVDTQLTPRQQFFTKLQAGVTSGTAPDVFWMSPVLLPLYGAGGVLKSVNDQHYDTSVYPQQLVSLCENNGNLYGLPKDMDTIAVWYNKKLFDAAGVA